MLAASAWKSRILMTCRFCKFHLPEGISGLIHSKLTRVTRLIGRLDSEAAPENLLAAVEMTCGRGMLTIDDHHHSWSFIKHKSCCSKWNLETKGANKNSKSLTLPGFDLSQNSDPTWMANFFQPCTVNWDRWMAINGWMDFNNNIQQQSVSS